MLGVGMPHGRQEEGPLVSLPQQDNRIGQKLTVYFKIASREDVQCFSHSEIGNASLR